MRFPLDPTKKCGSATNAILTVGSGPRLGKARIKVCVDAAGFEQLAVNTSLDDPAMFQNEDLRSVANRAQTVGDDKAGAPGPYYDQSYDDGQRSVVVSRCSRP